MMQFLGDAFPWDGDFALRPPKVVQMPSLMRVTRLEVSKGHCHNLAFHLFVLCFLVITECSISSSE